jgi:glycerate kinase
VRVLVAPDKFKGSLTAAEVAEHIGRGLRERSDSIQAVLVPVADGGDGTLDAALRAGFERVRIQAAGPAGEPAGTSYARRGDEAVIELAAICGLQRFAAGRRDPLPATSYGLGEAVLHAATAGCRRIVLGLGGSASTDGGAGMLMALGARITDSDGAPIPLGGAPLVTARQLDLTALHPALGAVEILVASDVQNPLFGPDGAAAVYAPQKGATPDEAGLLDRAMRHWASLVAHSTGRDLSAQASAGAAGGVGFAALAVLDARMRPGIELVLELVGFADKLAGSCLVVTGEGGLDEQTLAGKAPAGVARAARGTPVVAVAGHCTLSPRQLHAIGISAVYALDDLEPDLRTSMAQAGPLLERIVSSIADRWLRPAEHTKGAHA